jgi:hypothetical protein
MGLARRRGKMRFLESILLGNQAFYWSADIFKKLTEAFIYKVKNFQPCSFDVFSLRALP